MIIPERIYVAIDFKPSISSVLSYAIWLSNIFACKKLTLFHIMEYTLTPPAYLMPYINKEKKKIEEQLKELEKQISKFSVETECKVILGRLIESMREVIRDEKSFTVLGFKHYVTRPSTSERLLKGMKTPALIVKGKDFESISPQNIRLQKILCPVDFSSVSLRALDFAKELALRCGCELTVIHIIPEKKIRGILEQENEIQKYLEYLKEEAQEKIKKIDENLRCEIVAGIPSEEILKRVEQHDLVVIGSKGRSYSEAIMIGSVAESVIKNSPKPILLIH